MFAAALSSGELGLDHLSCGFAFKFQLFAVFFFVSRPKTAPGEEFRVNQGLII